jgi:hypothetical protein
MRISKMYLSVAIVAALLVAPAVMAEVATSCTTSDGNWTITLEHVSPSGSGVVASYLVEGTLTPNLIVGTASSALTGVTSVDANANGIQTYYGAEGDPLYDLAANDGTLAAFKINPQLSVGPPVHYELEFSFSDYVLVSRQVIIKYGSKGNSVIEGGCAIAVPTEGSSNPYETKEIDETEVIGGKCVIHAKTLPNGEVDVQLIPGVSDPNCSISDPIPPEDMTVSFNGGSPQPLKFNGGGRNNVIISGTGSCGWKQYYPNWGSWRYICW